MNESPLYLGCIADLPEDGARIEHLVGRLLEGGEVLEPAGSDRLLELVHRVRRVLRLERLLL